jgi:hypothetical protein
VLGRVHLKVLIHNHEFEKCWGSKDEINASEENMHMSMTSKNLFDKL